MAKSPQAKKDPKGFLFPLFTFARRVAGEDPRLALLSLTLSTFLALTEGAGLLLILPLAALAGLIPFDRGSRIAAWLPNWQFPLWSLLLVFVTIVTLRSILSYWSGILLVRYTQEHVHRLRRQVFQALSRSSWRAFLDVDPASLVQALTMDLQREAFALTSLIQLVKTLALLVIHGSLAAMLGPQFALLAFVAGIGLSLTMGRQHRAMLSIGRNLQVEHRDLQAATREQIATLKLFKAHGLTHKAMETLERINDRIAQIMIGASKRRGLVGVFFSIGSACSLALAVWLAVRWARMRPVDLTLLVMVFSRLLPRIGALQTELQGIMQGLGPAEATQRMIESLEVDGQEDGGGKPGEALVLEKALRLEGLSFSYLPGVPVLQELDLELPVNLLTVVEGPSGCGKSTLVDVVLGLLKPSSGRILLDGVELSDELLPRWLRGVAMVTQTPLLFDGSLRDNLLWAAPEATEAELLDALERAGAANLATQRPEGLDAPVGEGGRYLSGGEQRRLSLARALLRKPGFLVLDEPLTGLDPPTAEAVAETLVKLRKDTTILAVCHTGPLLKRADRVVALPAVWSWQGSAEPLEPLEGGETP